MPSTGRVVNGGFCRLNAFKCCLFVPLRRVQPCCIKMPPLPHFTAAPSVCMTSGASVLNVQLFFQVFNMKNLLSLLAVAALLGGCAVHTPSGSIVIDPDRSVRSGGGGGGGFCPPGQAKKGNC